MKEGQRKVALAIVGGLVLLLVLVAGITYPRPRDDEVVALGYTNFTGLEVAAPTTYATGTPAVVIDNDGLGTILELRDAQTPVWYVSDGGAVTGAGQTFSGLLNANGGIAVDTSAFSVADTTGNTVVSGTLAVTDTSTFVGAVAANGGLTVDTSAFSVADTTGNTVVSGTLVVTDAVTLQGTLDVDGNISSGTGSITVTDSMHVTDAVTLDINVENVMLPTVISASVPYTPASGTIGTIGDGEMWYVHAVYAEVTTNFDCTGDDCTLDIGDGGDPDGLLDLDDGELQASDTEGTGAPAGWQGFMSTDTRGAYLANGHGFIYAPSGGAETIDFAVGGTDPAAGQAYIYVIYTRFK